MDPRGPLESPGPAAAAPSAAERRGRLRWLKGNAYLDVFLGLALIVTAALDAVEAATAFEAMLGLEIRAHHGLLLLGILQLVKGLGDLLAGLRSVSE